MFLQLNYIKKNVFQLFKDKEVRIIDLKQRKFVLENVVDIVFVLKEVLVIFFRDEED